MLLEISNFKNLFNNLIKKIKQKFINLNKYLIGVFIKHIVLYRYLLQYKI